ncbi:MAG: PAS domain-containing protein, partial [Dehalococcoidaceae bacterium]|nr:PAS domain-containing protein [Dehalococcoidaceae bacterium]
MAEPVSCANDIFSNCCRLESTPETTSELGEQQYKPPDFEFWHALNCLTHGIRIISTDYSVTFTNDAFAGMAGISAYETIGKKCWTTFTDSFCHTDKCILHRISRGEASVSIESERTRPDGTSIPCRVSAFPLYSPKGQLIGIMESFRDTTRRRELQEKLDETEDRYRALVELGAEV